MLAALAISATLMSSVANAQVLKGQILGTVTDSSGSVIPASAVTVTETTQNVVRTGETNESGLYVFTNLDPGVYEIRVEVEGFNAAVRSDVDLLPNTTVRVNLTLNPGSVTETVVVTGAPPLLQTDRADTGAKIEQKQLQELPLLYNRNYQGLMALVPGVGKLSRPHSQFYNSQDSLSVRVNGQGRQYNNFQIEGIENKIDNGNLTALVPPAEAIQTVDISTSNFDPEFGNAGGSVVNVTLRSGTNDIHGSLFYFHRNENLQARQVFASGKAPTVYNQFGGTLGGPIIKNKMFIFGDYQGSRDHLGQVIQPKIPSLPFRAGDFSGESALIYDPATGNSLGEGRTPFANNIVPQSRISPIAASINGFISDPNRTGAGDNNFEQNQVRVKNLDAFDVKWDWIVSQKGRLTVRYSRQEATVTDCGVYGSDCGKYGGPYNNGFQGTGPATTQSPAISYSHVFSPTMVYEGRFGIVRNRNDAINADTGLTTSADIGIPGVNISQWTSGLSEIRIADFTRPVVGFSPSLPWARSVTFFGFTNNFTKTAGNHIIRFGGEMRRERNDLLQTQTFNPRGRFVFENGQTGTVEDTNRGRGNAYAAFLLDVPNLTGRDIDVQFPTRRELIWATYIQDKWQITPKLTLDLGMRWEIEMASVPRGDANYSNYIIQNNTLELNGIGNNPFNNGIENDIGGLGPRLGLAYRFDEKTVIRAGYGISYISRRMGQQNFPVKQNNSFPADNSFVSARTMAEGFPEFVAFEIPDNGIIDLNDPANALFAAQTFTAVRPEQVRPYVQSWNFAIQRALSGGFVLDVAYVGNRGVHNLSSWNYNAGRIIGAGNAGRPLAGPYGRTQDTNLRLATNTYYHSLQVKFDRRFSNGFGLTTAYTFAKAINFSDDTGGLSIDGLTEEFMSSNKGRQGTDRTQVFTQSYSYEIPLGRGKKYLQSGPGAWILGDWQVQGILSLMTGEPFTITSPTDTLNAPGNQQRANVLGTPTMFNEVAGPSGNALWFSTNSFETPAQDTFGDAGRENIEGPGYANLDFSIFKRFPAAFINEDADFTLRIEAWNFFNTPHFNNPNGSTSSGNFGKVTSAQNDSRQFQLGLTLRF